MAYKNDIFISYRRNPETLEWINNHLVPLLSLRLGFELGRVRDQYHFMDLSDMTTHRT